MPTETSISKVNSKYFYFYLDDNGEKQMIPKEAFSNPSDFLFMNKKGEIYTRDEDGSL
jgi:hypothetical protein